MATVAIDYVVYIRIYLLRLVIFLTCLPETSLVLFHLLVSIILWRMKIFIHIIILAFGVLLPVTYTTRNFEDITTNIKDITFGEIDKFSISNVPPASKRYE